MAELVRVQSSLLGSTHFLPACIRTRAHPHVSRVWDVHGTCIQVRVQSNILGSIRFLLDDLGLERAPSDAKKGR